MTLTFNEPEHWTQYSDDAKSCLTRYHENGRYGNHKKLKVWSEYVKQ